MFMLEYRNKPNPKDVEMSSSQFLSYQQSYFWFNNSVKNYPEFDFRDDKAFVEEYETFCLHVWYKDPSREKAYSQFKDLLTLPDCKNGPGKTKNVWGEKSPQTGLNFKPWKRIEQTLDNCTTQEGCVQEC